MSLANNIEFLRRLPKLNELKGLTGLSQGLGRAARSSRLTETVGFGTNPGDLKMFSYLPGDQRARQKLPLVVVLHGCTQNAAGYDIGAGWSTLAARPNPCGRPASPLNSVSFGRRRRNSILLARDTAAPL